MKIDENLLLEYLSGELKGENRSYVEDWITSSEENLETASQLYFVLSAGDAVASQKKAVTDTAYDNFKKLVHQKSRRRRFINTIHILERVAAVLFIPLFIAAICIYESKNTIPPEHTQYITIESKPGIVSSVDLPDGSKVWLNADGYLKYPVSFDSETREVELVGQAYFDIAKDEKKPFLVKASNNYTIEVYGTEFNVSAYADDDVIETTLVNGSVKLSIAMPGKNEVVTQCLKPNEMAVYSKEDNTVNTNTINTEYETAWKDGIIVFKNHPMDRVLKVLSRYYDVEFEVSDERVMQAAITGKFEQERLIQVLEYLRLASGIKYKIHGSSLSEDFSIQKRTIEIFK